MEKAEGHCNHEVISLISFDYAQGGSLEGGLEMEGSLPLQENSRLLSSSMSLTSVDACRAS